MKFTRLFWQSHTLKHKDRAIQTVYLSIFGNLLLAVAKGITGVLGNSFALVADGVESTADVFASILVWVGLKYSTKPADDNHPYGHGKMEAIVTFMVVGFLVVSAAYIAYQSIQNIRTPHEVPEAYTLIVLGVIIVIKEIFYRVVSRRSKETHSSSLKADAWHHRSDAITSLMAFIGITIALIFGEQFAAADDWAALFASGFIMYNAYLIFRPALGEIMDEHLYEDMEEQIRVIAKTVEGIVYTEKCHIRKAGMVYHVDLHAVVDGTISVKEGHDIAHNLKEAIQEELPEVADVLIHVEPDYIYDVEEVERLN